MYVCVNRYIYIYKYMYIYMCVYVCVYAYICIRFVYMCVYVCARACVCVRCVLSVGLFVMYMLTWDVLHVSGYLCRGGNPALPEVLIHTLHGQSRIRYSWPPTRFSVLRFIWRAPLVNPLDPFKITYRDACNVLTRK